MSGTSVAYTFGPFRLNPVNYQCLREGTRVALFPKGPDLLLLLVAKVGALVSNDEIMTALWRDVSVTDNALIQTVSGRGYRFIGSVDASTGRPVRRPRSIPQRPCQSPIEQACGRLRISRPIARLRRRG